MFSIKSKLDHNLRHIMDQKCYKSYRVLIYCKNLQQNIESKVKSYRGEVLRSIPFLNLIAARVTDKALERLIEYPEVEYICQDSYAHLCGTSVWSSNHAVVSERYMLTGKGVGIGLVDSGTYPHTDLLNPHNRIKFFLDLINNCKYPYDDNGHGTFISGILCGSGYSSKKMYRGVAENAGLFSIKAFDALGKGFISDILFALNLLLEKSEEQNIKVICLPFEIRENLKLIQALFSSLFAKAVEKNIIIVVPAGHNGSGEDALRGIAALSNCITVGGLDTTREIKPYQFSSEGFNGKRQKPELCASAVDICSLNCVKEYVSERNGVKLYPPALEKPYTNYSGTSCAAAYVAGLCALLFENNSKLTFKDITSLMKVSARTLEMPVTFQGIGVIDINKLLP